MPIDRHDRGQPKPVIVVIFIKELTDCAQNTGGINADETITKWLFGLIRLMSINKPSNYYHSNVWDIIKMGMGSYEMSSVLGNVFFMRFYSLP